MAPDRLGRGGNFRESINFVLIYDWIWISSFHQPSCTITGAQVGFVGSLLYNPCLGLVGVRLRHPAWGQHFQALHGEVSVASTSFLLFIRNWSFFLSVIPRPNPIELHLYHSPRFIFFLRYTFLLFLFVMLQPLTLFNPSFPIWFYSSFNICSHPTLPGSTILFSLLAIVCGPE